MKMNHVILTDETFRAPNWQLGLENLSIFKFTGGKPYVLPGEKNQFLVWIVSSVPDWNNLVRHYSEDSPVIVLSKLLTLPEMQTAIEAGARGYMEVLTNPAQLKQAANAVSEGGLWIAPPMMNRLLSILSDRMPAPQIPNSWSEKLSPRELQVAKIVAAGVSNREVADELHITVRTVKEHLTSIFSKLEISDRLQLILMARGA
ncbi:response regulator transcription factor [Wenzhouxiangella limi]|uniref:Response regulator transcription factor n=1 Tax=Wenzhouxiangella limi TaxID=2707351 RepID=A0A845VE06_9GAMM|nr:response regulator transcription factor [Wenzhouxiangella limi]NDY95489.1 response regulator transcription factor [Wenzhouxiangella limi]